MDNILEECKKYFEGDILASEVLMNKYLLKTRVSQEFIEKNPNNLIERLVKEFYKKEKQYPNPLSKEKIRNALDRFKYIIPGGSGLYGIGNNQQDISIANCFVVESPEDSIGGIVLADEEISQIMKRRGGVGIDISTLRPKGTGVSGAAITSDGITCFMEKFSQTTLSIAQNGRRGALMISLDCRHPDLIDFIKIKTNLKRVNGANISIKWHGDFLRAVKNNEKYTLRFPINSSVKNAQITKEVNAKYIWDLFIESNYKSAEPGCLFWDTITKNSLSDCYEDFPTISTNPCGEQPINPGGSCILMALNLSSFIQNPFTENAKFSYSDFADYIIIASNLIDDMIDIEIEKNENLIKTINKKTNKKIKQREIDLWKNILKNYKLGRRVGLGITGFADMLAYQNIKYDSDEAIKITEDIFSFFNKTIMERQAELAKERGAFKVWDWEKEKNCHYIKILPKNIQDKIKKYGRRNIAVTTIAPTGSISMLAQVSSGIEPVYQLEYNRRRKLYPHEKNKTVEYVDDNEIQWTSYKVIHKGLEKWKEINLDKHISESPYYNATANEINWQYRVKLQGIIQKYIHSSISSTVNLPQETTIEDVNNLYLEAYKEGCKGITIYVDGSREGVLTTADSNRKICNSIAPKRPKILECDIHYSSIQGHDWIFFVGKLNNVAYEIFGGRRDKIEIPKKYKTGWIIKNGRDENNNRIYDLCLGSLDNDNEKMLVKDMLSEFKSDTGSYTRIVSTMLRHGIPIKFICEQLYKDSEADLFTFEKGIARVLKKYIKDNEQASGLCDQCNSKLIYKDGCAQCVNCGWSKCN